MAEDRIRVAARIRPFSASEEDKGETAAIVAQDAHTVVVRAPEKEQAGPPRLSTGSTTGGGGGASGGSEADAQNGVFAFDYTFDSPAGETPWAMQERVYEQIGRPVLHNALGGVSGCLFAYGQTGSGKTFSLFGTEDAPGVLPRLADELMESRRQADGGEAVAGGAALPAAAAAGSVVSEPGALNVGEEFSVKASFLELYNENLVDLLSDSREPLRLFENNTQGVVVPGLSETDVTCKDEFDVLLGFAMKSRSVGSTCVNAHSSRSHALIQLKVQRKMQDCTMRAKIHVIDLAGSERQKRAKNEGARMREGIHINVSLSALGLVISRLSDIAQGRNHCSVPFRDSKLTFLLKDSLAGASRTQVLVALSPSSSNYEESLSTLRFAQSVKRIRTRVVADIVQADSTQDVRALQAEVERLQAELDLYRAGASQGLPSAPAVAVDGLDAVRRLEGRYLSVKKRLIEVGADGYVRFLGGSGHHPIRILPPANDNPGGPLRLQSDVDRAYRYVLVSEEESGALVWRHEDAKADVSRDQTDVRWQRIAVLGPGEGRVAQALRALQQLAGESKALGRVCAAVPALARGAKPAVALEAIDALVVLCMEVDEANDLLERRAASVASSRWQPDIPRVDVTWLAHEPNEEVSAKKLLQVKLLRQTSSGHMELTHVWSLPEFGRRLCAMREQMGLPPSGSVVATLSAEGNGSPVANLKQRFDSLNGVAEDPQEHLLPISQANGSPPVKGSKRTSTSGATPCSAVVSPPLEFRKTSPPGSSLSGGSMFSFANAVVAPVSTGVAPGQSPPTESKQPLPAWVTPPRSPPPVAVPPPERQASVPLGMYRSSSGGIVEVDANGFVKTDGVCTSYIEYEGERVFLRSCDETESRSSFQLVARADTGVLLWDKSQVASEEEVLSSDVKETLVAWTPDIPSDNVLEGDDVVTFGSPVATSRGKPATPVFGELLQACGSLGSVPKCRFNVMRDTSPRRGRASLGAAPSSTSVGIAGGSGSGGGSFSMAAAASAAAHASCAGSPLNGGLRGGTVVRGPNSPGFSAGGRPRSAGSAEVGIRETVSSGVAAAPQGSQVARERSARDIGGRRSRTPPTAAMPPGEGTLLSTSKRRSQSAVSVRPRLNTVAGVGELAVPAKAFDKNSLRLRNGAIFVDALAKWETVHARLIVVPQRRLLSGGCSVYVRKRPMFEKDTRRCDFDVLTVLGNAGSDGNSATSAGSPLTTIAGAATPPPAASSTPWTIGQDIVHHACMFDRSLVAPFVIHTQFQFDGVFDAVCSNEDVYRVVGRPLLEHALDGKTATLFIFGQTGSGKTYTMRAIERMVAADLFDSLSEGAEVSVTYFELAGRKALDLLTDQKAEIRLREEENGCFLPHDCQESSVQTAEELLTVMVEAAARRATDATTVNSVSSRSHAVCRISVPASASSSRQAVGGSAASRPGCLLLVDCAGTERSRDTLHFKGQHQKESAEINSSLFALKDCIRWRQAAIHRQGGLSQDGLPLKLPSVRATPLTKVLSESLISASAQLAAIATVSPNATDSEHTIDTLRTVYALSGRGEGRIIETRQALM
eukprot:TRINITY_DN6102_c0_g1_i1.p1 TRINITY_DN6102_c0_g1~~TRINITY_DN6102_c0_g1_i1.p1  ORF type:complete len:1613 (+),score=322.71 TRINITY_DN6102_c0_g1_i1:152-4840(+)